VQRVIERFRSESAENAASVMPMWEMTEEKTPTTDEHR
jgi:hypothetical protein